MIALDKFYTKSSAAKQCISFLSNKLNLDYDKITIIEPSAGNGRFLEFLPSHTFSCDIMPEDERIQTMNFFDYDEKDKRTLCIGNPPFGKRSKTAIDFFNKAAKISEIIAFVVPVSFMKWSVQKSLSNDFKLIDYLYLEPNSFTNQDKDSSVRCVFQIWVKENSSFDKNFINLRLKKSPPISHKDFTIWQYNATEGSLGVVKEDWEIAVYRQGYHDYNKLFSRKDYEEIKDRMTGVKKQQFFFIKPLSQKTKDIILNMDFNSLAERNTSTRALVRETLLVFIKNY